MCKKAGFPCLIALMLVLAACAGSDPPAGAAERREAPDAAAPRRETVFDPMTSTIGRAEGVQSTVDEQAAEQRRRIDAAER